MRCRVSTSVNPSYRNSLPIFCGNMSPLPWSESEHEEECNPEKRQRYKTMNRLIWLVHFHLDDHKYALFLSAVLRIIRVVEITNLPKAPEIVAGIINLQGQVIPVFDIRMRFRLPPREVHLTDQLIIATTAKWTVALSVDSVDDVTEIPEERITAGGQILPGLGYVAGVMKTEGGMVLIHDLGKFLSLPEEKTLSEAIEALNHDERKDG
jgi:purine-binding chemotaxis protein CheW